MLYRKWRTAAPGIAIAIAPPSPHLEDVMAQKRKKPAGKADAITMLVEDHAIVDQLFKEFEELHEEGEDTAEVIQTVRQALTVHSALEKEIFYPAIRKRADDEMEELLDEAEVEHRSVDDLIRTLGTRRMAAKKREANFTVLIEYVRHHVKEEEKEMFPKLRKLRGVDLTGLAERMLTRRIALHRKMRMPPF
jgi:hemerythrin superfamily protein